MWNVESKKYCETLLCANKCLNGFHKCVKCLPTQEDLLKNYKEWNRCYSETHGHNQCMPRYWDFDDENEYYTYCNTNCELTARMIQEKFGFGVGYLPNAFVQLDEFIESLFEKQNKYQFAQVSIMYGYNIEHIFTMIGEYILHSFQDKYELRIIKMNQEWKNNFYTKNWVKVCELEDCNYFPQPEKFAIIWRFPAFLINI
jgi:hypothetical protein